MLAAFLLSLLAQADAGTAPPRAQLVVPDSVRARRSASHEAQATLPLFSNPAILEALGDLPPTPGAWAEYGVEVPKKAIARVRLSLLPRPAPAGHYWLEVATAAPGLLPQAARMMLHGSPTRAANIDSLEIYLLGQAPIEIPVGDLRDKLPEPPKPGAVPKIARGKPQRVQVRAGSFLAEPLTIGETKLWRSSEVPLWGLVKARSPHETVELLGSGREGAHSVFPPEPGEPEVSAQPASETKDGGADQGKGSESTK